MANPPSPRQDRTHKGGAVLWFLRKHAPMPQTYGYTNLDLKTPSLSSSAPADTYAEAQRTKQAKNSSRGLEQRAFLHQTLKAIGTELDEGPNRGIHAAPRSARQRDILRQHYATHADNECEDLRKAVTAKEAEISTLKQQVAQLKRYVEATRIAAERRKSRLRKPEGNAGNFSAVTAAGIAGIAKTKKNILSMAGSAVWDADSPSAKAKNTDVVEELHQNLVRAMEEDQAMRAQVEDHMRQLDQQTIRRKSAEAGLFNTNADILRLRAQALQQEARVTRLANELRRVYKHLPRVVDQRLAKASDARDRMMHQELANLREIHREEHFKFMDNHQIDDEHDIVRDEIMDVSLHERDVVRALEQGDAAVKSSMDEMVTVRLALASLNEAWAKFTNDFAQPIRSVGSRAAKPAMSQTEDEPEHEDDIRLLMHQASLAAASIEEMLSMMNAEPIDSDDDDDSSSNIHSSRHPSMRGSRPSSRPGSRPQSRMTLGAVPSMSPEPDTGLQGNCVPEHHEQGPEVEYISRHRSV